MFVYIAFTTVIMILIRPIVVNKIVRSNKELRKSLNNVTFTSLYFYPILSVIQAIAGGLICKNIRLNIRFFFFFKFFFLFILDYSYPILSLIVFLITNAIHLTEAFERVAKKDHDESITSFVSYFQEICVFFFFLI